MANVHRIFVILLFLVSSLINPLFNQNGMTVLLFINDTPITLEALVYGIFSSLTLVSVIVWFFTFSSVMTSEKIIYIFGRISPKTALVKLEQYANARFPIVVTLPGIVTAVILDSINASL